MGERDKYRTLDKGFFRVCTALQMVMCDAMNYSAGN